MKVLFIMAALLLALVFVNIVFSVFPVKFILAIAVLTLGSAVWALWEIYNDTNT